MNISIYTEQFMREADVDYLRTKMGGSNIVDLRYSYDTAFAADNITSIRRITELRTHKEEKV